MKKIEIIVRTTEDGLAAHETTVMEWIEGDFPHRKPHDVLRFRHLEIYLSQHRVFKNGQEIYMSRYEYGVLSFMAQHPGQLFTKKANF